jgi:hypothetical protein
MSQPVTAAHAAVGIGGVGAVTQLAAILSGGFHVDPTLAANEAGLVVMVVGGALAVAYAWLRKKDPELVAGFSELQHFEPDNTLVAQAVVNEIEKRANAGSHTVVLPPAAGAPLGVPLASPAIVPVLPAPPVSLVTAEGQPLNPL